MTSPETTWSQVIELRNESVIIEMPLPNLVSVLGWIFLSLMFSLLWIIFRGVKPFQKLLYDLC